ncbi:MAG: M23 family metallopeptidase [Magnetococcales bacterium]|nr:M23 family metallopeptidase [Magnetococcales bacterium]
MQSLYLIPASLRNHPLRALPMNGDLLTHIFKNEIFPRLFTLLVPALLGSMAATSWLNTHGGVGFSFPYPPTPTPMVRVYSGEKPPALNNERVQPLSIVSGDQTLLPAMEALEGLFAPVSEPGETQEVDPEMLPAAHVSHKGLSPLEVHVNESLLEALDPYLLSREQKKIFAKSVPTGHPLPEVHINSPFGFRMHPTMQETRFHPGVDLQAPMNTPITATADGVVEFAGVDTGKLGMNGLGQVISLQHNFGFHTTYGHLNKVQVKAGDFVRKGDLIGMTGNSGIVTAPHLHYEIRFIHQFLNPAPFLEWTTERSERLFKEKSVKWLALIDQLGSPRLTRPGTLSSAHKPIPALPEATPMLITSRHLSKRQTPRQRSLALR